nr:GFA family protein [Hyphomicrobium sp.]
MAQCHCLDCQRATGTGHMSNATFNAADVEISGATSSYASASDSGNTLTRHFCPTCGARLFLTSEKRPGLITMAAGAFDDSNWFEPELVLFTKRRPPWDITTDKVPNFEAGPTRSPKPKPE